MDFERATLDAVISARNKAVSATGVRQTAKAEGELTQALGRLFALTEAYPDLKATGNVAQLQEELTSTENKIGFARQLYNDVATQYNTKQMQFPTNLVAGLAKASPAELWEIEDAGGARRARGGSVAEQTGAVSDEANLFAQQQSNRRRSAWLVVGFIAFFAWVGFGGDLAFYLLTADAGAAVLSSRLSVHRHRHHHRRRGICWYSWRYGPERVLWATGAWELVEPATPEQKQLVNVVEEMAIASGLPKPKIWIVPTPIPTPSRPAGMPHGQHRRDRGPAAHALPR